jgi:hypothetical protein
MTRASPAPWPRRTDALRADLTSRDDPAGLVTGFGSQRVGSGCPLNPQRLFFGHGVGPDSSGLDPVVRAGRLGPPVAGSQFESVGST